MRSEDLPTPMPTGEDPHRRTWLIAASVAGGVTVAATAVPFVASFGPSERVRAMAGSDPIDVGDIPPGGMKTVEWRGKPVWIVRRTPEMLAALPTQVVNLADPNSLREQQPPYARNATRSIRPDIFVSVSICTHLGCSLISVPRGKASPGQPSDWAGGFFCPCHGSYFDGAGRAYKDKPAPTNLEVPPHKFLSDTRLVIGEDPSST